MVMMTSSLGSRVWRAALWADQLMSSQTESGHPVLEMVAYIRGGVSKAESGGNVTGDGATLNNELAGSEGDEGDVS